MSAIVRYRCPEHGESSRCEVNDAGERVCPDCSRVVDIIQAGEQ